MEQNNQPTNPNQPVQNDPIQPAQDQTPVVPQETPPATPPVAPAVPPKKSRRVLWIVLAAGVVLIAGLVATGFYLSSQATSAAEQYEKDVAAHLDALISDAQNARERVELFKKPAQLNDVFLGSLLSPDYQQSIELQKKYNAYVDKGLAIMTERAAVLDLSPYFKDLSAQLDADVSVEMPEITNEETKQQALNTVESLKKRGEGFIGLADRFAAYPLDDKYQEYQDELAEELKYAGGKWIELSQIQEKIANKQIEMLDAQERGDDAAATGASAELIELIINGDTQMKTITADYQQRTPAISTAINAFTQKILADEYIQGSLEEAGNLGEETYNFRQTLLK
jgi:hypothetical protein